MGAYYSINAGRKIWYNLLHEGEKDMKKKVLIISSSLRPDSNSHALCEEVAKGVESAGGEAQVVRLLGKKIVGQE